MKRIKGLLQIGGFSKSAGKTTLCTRIIQRFHLKHNIIGIKISCHPPNSGSKAFIQKENFTIYQEKNKNKNEDTSKMLKFGALSVYYIHAEDVAIREAFIELHDYIGHNSLIVCESNSLSKFFQPDLLLMCHNEDEKIKPSALNLKEEADLIVDTKSIDDRDTAGFLEIEQGKWQLVKLQD